MAIANLFDPKHVPGLGAGDVAHEQRVRTSGARDEAMQRRVVRHLTDPLGVDAGELYQPHLTQYGAVL